MALKKLCSCGKIIDYSDSHCSNCKDNYKSNNNNKDTQSIYNSKAWRVLTKVIEQRDNNLCLVCLSNKRISYKDTVHHIVPLRDDVSLAYNKDNLICLCESCHQKVHSAYKQGRASKSATQKKLKTLIVTPRGDRKSMG